MTETPYCYYASLVRTIDGDTIELLIDEGFRHSWKVSCRLAHINAPEISTPEGKTAKDYLTNRIPVGATVYIQSKKLDKYGRPIVQLFYSGVDINQEMVHKGFAVNFM